MSPAGFDGQLEEAVTSSLVNGYLPCAVALKLAERLNVEASVVGDTVERLGLRISDCQLGCFKLEKARHEDLDEKNFSRELIEAIKSSTVEGRLACATAHQLSRDIRTGLRETGDAATKLKVKVSHCQLNCF